MASAHSLGLMTSSGTWRLAMEISGPLAGLPCREEGAGDSERKRGLPGAEPTVWARGWPSAGEPGSAPIWRRGFGAAVWPREAGPGAAAVTKGLPAVGCTAMLSQGKNIGMYFRF